MKKVDKNLIHFSEAKFEILAQNLSLSESSIKFYKFRNRFYVVLLSTGLGIKSRNHKKYKINYFYYLHDYKKKL